MVTFYQMCMRPKGAAREYRTDIEDKASTKKVAYRRFPQYSCDYTNSTVLLVLLHNIAAHNVNVTGHVCYLT
jgi:hypothetical protein